jgi:hypothetical protein
VITNCSTSGDVTNSLNASNGPGQSDTELWHVYTIANGLIERMDVKEADGNTEGPSAAFSGS